MEARLRWTRLRLKGDLTTRLRYAKAKTGLTPNLLCRLGLCLSLTEQQVPSPELYDEEGLEFHREVLFGEWDELFEALLRQRLAKDGLDVVRDFLPQLRAHLNRGTESICSRVKGVEDIALLLPRELTAFAKA